MKKLLAILLALSMIFCLAACVGADDNGNDSKNESEASSTINSNSFITGVDDDGSSDDGETLELEGTEEFVVCALESSNITLNSIKDIKNYRVICAGDDAIAIGNHYGDKSKLGTCGSPQDGKTDLKNNKYDLFIMKKSAAKSYEKEGIKIVLDPIVIE